MIKLYLNYLRIKFSFKSINNEIEMFGIYPIVCLFQIIIFF